VKAPHSYPTFLVDGQVVGRWRMANGRFELEPFEELDPRDRHELEAEGERLAELYAGTAG
jgi:Winged helix DNA-binding domain